jgi:Ca-activated chloride channel homolog
MGNGMNGCSRIWPSMASRSGLAIALALLCGAALGRGQFKSASPRQETQRQEAQHTSEGAPTFSVKVNLVRLLVSVRDSAGAILPHLNKQDFRVADSGVPQEIAVFERNTSLALSVAILIDTSGSTRKDLHDEVESVLRFLPALLGAGNPDDAFALLSFNWRTNMEVDYSRDKKRADRALRALHGEGGTSLYDAVYLASDTLTEREGRHVIVVVTDGGDTTSYKQYGDALAAAQRADAVMYPIVVVPIPNDTGRNVGGEHALATLAASTGGRIFYPEGYSQLNTAFSDIIHELRTQYLLGFYPKAVREAPRLFHPVAVSTRDASLKVSARSGYYEP